MRRPYRPHPCRVTYVLMGYNQLQSLLCSTFHPSPRPKIGADTGAWRHRMSNTATLPLTIFIDSQDFHNFKLMPFQCFDNNARQALAIITAFHYNFSMVTSNIKVHRRGWLTALPQDLAGCMTCINWCKILQRVKVRLDNTTVAHKKYTHHFTQYIFYI